VPKRQEHSGRAGERGLFAAEANDLRDT
jgi:hypothetical protein